MCQDYIQKQRQLQYESHTMTQPGYSAVMDYVDKIGDNLKTPKVLLSTIFTNSQFSETQFSQFSKIIFRLKIELKTETHKEHPTQS